MEQRKQLAKRLAVVGLVKKAIELASGGPQPSDYLALAERSRLQALLSLDGQLVQQQITKIAWVLVVLENLVDVHRSLSPRLEYIGKRLPA